MHTNTHLHSFEKVSMLSRHQHWHSGMQDIVGPPSKNIWDRPLGLSAWLKKGKFPPASPKVKVERFMKRLPRPQSKRVPSWLQLPLQSLKYISTAQYGSLNQTGSYYEHYFIYLNFLSLLWLLNPGLCLNSLIYIVSDIARAWIKKKLTAESRFTWWLIPKKMLSFHTTSQYFCQWWWWKRWRIFQSSPATLPAVLIVPN